MLYSSVHSIFCHRRPDFKWLIASNLTIFFVQVDITTAAEGLQKEIGADGYLQDSFLWSGRQPLWETRKVCSEKSQCTSHYILTSNSSAGAQDYTDPWENRSEADCSHTAIIYSFTSSLLRAYPTSGHGGAGAYQSRAGSSCVFIHSFTRIFGRFNK